MSNCFEWYICVCARALSMNACMRVRLKVISLTQIQAAVIHCMCWQTRATTFSIWIYVENFRIANRAQSKQRLSSVLRLLVFAPYCTNSVRIHDAVQSRRHITHIMPRYYSHIISLVFDNI